MSKETTTLNVSLAEQAKAIDAFAEQNNIVALTDGKSGMAASLAMAGAIQHMRALLTPEILKELMEIQGNSLGFKTDKDSSGGYAPEVVRDVFIAARIHGFDMVLNQVNIIGGNWYPTKQGFEAWMAKMGKAKKLTDFNWGYKGPKAVADNESVVTVTATWKWDGHELSIKDQPLTIRVNKGQGPDAIVGKAKRKLLGMVYARVTGTIITDGDVEDGDAAKTVIDVDGPASKQPGNVGTAALTEQQTASLKEILAKPEDAENANAWLRANGHVAQHGTYLDVKPAMADKIIGKPKEFITHVAKK